MLATLNNIISVFLIFFLTSCASNSLESRIKAADAIAQNHQFTKKLVAGGGFTFAVYERIIDPNLPYAFYIEKDGYIATQYGISDNPTPIKQMLFSLASLDDDRNVVYIARPCQYIDLKLDNHCSSSIYWTSKRLAPEVIEATNDVINTYTNKPFSVIGHSGGGSIAVLIATVNKNVKDIITVAANLDIVSFNAFHKVEGSMNGSLNPTDYAQGLKNIPQLHLAGGNDETVPPFVVEEYVKASNSPCVKLKIIPKAEHNSGWFEVWPSVLSTPIF
jgi:hypothetical protein